jgi:large subunit ribosomal protein L31
MKDKIHPKYVDCTITCVCGNVVKTRSTKPKINVEICSKCHPLYTGQRKILEKGGRVEKFRRRESQARKPSAEAQGQKTNAK